jgi:dUTP pyrophosphatase
VTRHQKVKLRFRFVDDVDTLLGLPERATEGSSGFDLRASLPINDEYSRDPVEIPSGGRVLVKTGLRMEIPVGFEGQIRPRSGLALKHGITVLNAPGTIDCDYRGEVGVILINHGEAPYFVKHGDKIAQLVVQSTVDVITVTETSLSDTGRGEGGFGSSDKA